MGRLLSTSVLFALVGGLCAGLATGCREDFPADFALDAGFVLPPDSGATDVGATDVGFPYGFAADVRPILEANCQTCHGNPTANLAPRSLVTYQDLTATDEATQQPVYELVAERVVSELLPMPPPSSGIFLSATEIAIIQVWAETGAPE